MIAPFDTSDWQVTIIHATDRCNCRTREWGVSISFPNETPEYRAARDALLASEITLRRQMEAVAAQLRALPPGGEVPEDYVFDAAGAGGAATVIRMSELFRGGDTLMMYHYMFPRHSRDERAGPTSGTLANVPLAEGPCPSCTALIDMWDGTMPHFEGLGGNLVVVARAPIARVAAFARDKGWKHTRLVSAANNTFRRDYGGDGPDGEPVPIMTVFRRWPDGVVRLHWASELIHELPDPGQDPRHPRDGRTTLDPVRPHACRTPGGRRADGLSLLSRSG